MIYLKFEEYAQEAYGYSEIVAINERNFNNFNYIPIRMRYCASYIFAFKDGKTVYLKDRDNTNYQYSSEDAVALALRAVLL